MWLNAGSRKPGRTGFSIVDSRREWGRRHSGTRDKPENKSSLKPKICVISCKRYKNLNTNPIFSSYSSFKDNPPVWVRGLLVLVARCSLRYKRSYLGPRRRSPKIFTSWLALITSTTIHIHLNATYTRKNYLIAPSFNNLCLYQTVLHGKLNLKAVTFFPLDCLRSLKKSCNAYQNM